jgi:hypothetical protein
MLPKYALDSLPICLPKLLASFWHLISPCPDFSKRNLLPNIQDFRLHYFWHLSGISSVLALILTSVIDSQTFKISAFIASGIFLAFHQSLP